MKFGFGITQTGRHVLQERYLWPGESATTCIERIATTVAEAERNYDTSQIQYISEKFFQLIEQGLFCPNSPTIMNAGKSEGQLAACFVLPVEDDIRDIFETLKNAAWIQQSGGGTGFSFGHLRPRGDVVHSTAGVASGPINFLKVFDQATESIKQGGARRGANMGILPVTHPDVEEFIHCKDAEGAIRNFNISVAVTNEFMTAAQKKKPWTLTNPRTSKPVKTVQANELLEAIAASAWKNGEPGLIFLDRINEDNPTPELGPIESTNPCGEQPLLPYEACNLGSLNIAAFLNLNKKEIDWERFRGAIHLGVRFLDNVIDVNHYPLQQIEQRVRLNRKIGLGLMGLADAFLLLELPYDAPEALKLAQSIASFFALEAQKASEALGSQRGTFPQGFSHQKKIAPRRNATITTVAPTGTISLITGCSAGIEPVFSFITKRAILNGAPVTDIHPYFEEFCQQKKIPLPHVLKWLEENPNSTSLHLCPELPASQRALFKTATAIDWKTHIEIQGAFQDHMDNGVSKTINLAENADKQTVLSAFLFAHQRRCKGITVYRYKSRKEQSQSLPSSIHEVCGTQLIAMEGCLFCPQCQLSLCGTD